MRNRMRGLRSCSKEAVTLLLQERPHRIGQAFAASFLSFTQPSPPELALPSHCTRAHAAFTSHFLWRNASFLTNKRLVASQLLSSSLVSHARRSPFCPPFVYFTPSIMQGLISQSRFELWHASAKSGEQNFCAGGSFPFTLA